MKTCTKCRREYRAGSYTSHRLHPAHLLWLRPKTLALVKAHSSARRACRRCPGVYLAGLYWQHCRSTRHRRHIQRIWDERQAKRHAERKTTRIVTRRAEMLAQAMEGATLQEIGDRYHISRQRVQQIVGSGVAKRRHRPRATKVCFVCGDNYSNWRKHEASADHQDYVRQLKERLRDLDSDLFAD